MKQCQRKKIIEREREERREKRREEKREREEKRTLAVLVAHGGRIHHNRLIGIGI
jgi:hypothetical protein